MSGNGLTVDALKQQHAAAITMGDTFKPQGISEAEARAYLDTDEGALYWYRLAETDPSAPSSTIDDRAIKHLRSGSELPRMETLSPGEPLAKIVPAGTSPSVHSPFWAKEAELDVAVKAGRNLSDHFGLPVVSEASRYDVYRITPKLPTQVFVNTVAATSELGGAVTKAGGVVQSLVPNRQLFNEPVYVKTVDNIPTLTAEVEHGLPTNLLRGAGVLGVGVTAYEGTQTVADAADLLRQGNTVGAQSQILHFGGSTAGGWAGAVLGAEAGGALGVESGPGLLATGAVGGVVGAVAGDKVIDAYDHYKIYTQTDPQGQTWRIDPKQPEKGWTSELPPVPGTGQTQNQHFTAAPELANRLNYQANTAAVELAMGRATSPRDPFSQPASAQDKPLPDNPPWTRDASGAWSRGYIDPMSFAERNLSARSVEPATPQRSAQLDAAAQRTIADNVASSKRGMAEQYQAA